MIGSGKYNFRSIASLDSSDFFYDKETKHFEIQYNKYFDYDYFQINNITYSYLSDKSFHYKNQILNPLKSYVGSFPNILVKRDLNDRLDFSSIIDDEIHDNTHSK